MTGMETRRMRRRPRRSMSRRERTVKAKFVTATEREVKVGEENPIREKMVAEKYIREFCEGIMLVNRIIKEQRIDKRRKVKHTKPQSCWRPWSKHAIVKARRFPGIRNSSDQRIVQTREPS